MTDDMMAKLFDAGMRVAHHALVVAPTEAGASPEMVEAGRELLARVIAECLGSRFDASSAQALVDDPVER